MKYAKKGTVVAAAVGLALAGIGSVVALADGDADPQTEPGVGLTPEQAALVGRTADIHGISLRIAPSEEFPAIAQSERGQVCVVGSKPGVPEFDVDGGEFGLCTTPTNLAKNGLIIARQLGDGPMTYFGFAPVDKTTITGSIRGMKSSQNGFFAAINAPTHPTEVTFSGAGGQTVAKLGGGS